MAQLERALAAGLEQRPDLAWQMLSVTLRHNVTMPLVALRKGLMEAWRRTRQSGSVARIMKRRVAASVRAVEITHSFRNGWHPHLHIGVLSSEWDADERETLSRVWEESCALVLGPAARPDRDHGIRWSARRLHRGDGGTRLQAYLTDIGLEFSHVSTKTARREDSRTSWQIAHAATTGDDESRRLWIEYEQATKGARAIELDDRAAALARNVDTRAELERGSNSDTLSFEGAAVVGEASVYVVLHPEMMALVRAYERIDPRATALWLDAAAAPGPLTIAAVTEKVDACVRWMVAKTRGRDPATLAA